MLQAMRDKIQGLIAGVIAGVIALTFALWGVQNYLRSGTSNVVAKVNGQEITQEQLRTAYERTKRNEMLRFGPGFSFDQKVQAELKQEILQQLIRQEAIYQAVTKMGLGVTRSQLSAMVAGMPMFQTNGKFSPERFSQLMSGMYYSEQTFFAEIERSLLRVQLEKGIVESAFVLPHEVTSIKKIFKQRRDFGYFTLSPERFIKTVQIAEEAVKKYYDTHQNEFLLPEKISIQYIELASSDLHGGSKPSEEQLKQFYQSHIESFSTPKKWQVTKILLPLSLKADAKTIENAKKRIEDIALQAKSGKALTNLAPEVKINTSWILRNELTQDFVTHLDKLRAGQVSAPFRAKDGFNLIKVLAIEPAKATPFVNVAAKVRQVYEHQQLTQAFSEASDKLADLVYTNSDTLEPAAKELGLKVKDTELFTSAGGKTGILANNKIIKTAFSDEVLKQRYNSNLIDIGTGKVMVLRVKDRIPEALQPLDQVRTVIGEKLRLEEAKNKAVNLANELLQALRSGKTEAQLISQYGLVWNKVSGAKYGQGGANANLIEAAFGLAKPKDKDVSAVIVESSGSYAILRLNKVYDDAASKEVASESNLVKSLPDVLGAFEYRSMMDYLMHQAKIKMIGKIEDKKNDSYE